MTTRREFIAGAAAAPMAIAMAGNVAAASVTASIAEVTPAVEKHPFRWWISSDGGEVFSEMFDSKEAALAQLEEYGEGCMIAECQQQDFHLDLRGDEVIELLYDQNEELMNEDGEFLDVTPEQKKELGAMVTATIQAWVEKNKIKTTAWTFRRTRNEISAPSEADDEQSSQNGD